MTSSPEPGSPQTEAAESEPPAAGAPVTGTVRSWVVNLGLAAGALLALIIVAWTRGAVTTGEQRARKASLLGAFRRDEVSRIVIEQRRPETAKVTVERDRTRDGPDAWVLRGVTREQADSERVRQLLDTLESATVLRRLNTEGLDRVRFGFSEPRAVLQIDMGPIAYRLLLGKPAAAPHEAFFVEVAGIRAPHPGVVAVSRSTAAELFLSPDDLRSRQLMPYTSVDLKQLALREPGGTRVLVRGEWGGWGSGPHPLRGGTRGPCRRRTADGTVEPPRSRASSGL